jgi:hypothetical protein
MTILGKLIADHLAGDIDVDIHLIVMHHEFSSCRARHQGQKHRPTVADVKVEAGVDQIPIALLSSPAGHSEETGDKNAADIV